MTYRLVPQEDINKLEKARKELFNLFQDNDEAIALITWHVTYIMWKITHTNYPEAIDISSHTKV